LHWLECSLILLLQNLASSPFKLWDGDVLCHSIWPLPINNRHHAIYGTFSSIFYHCCAFHHSAFVRYSRCWWSLRMFTFHVDNVI